MAKTVQRLRLNTVQNTRKTIARYLRVIHAEEESCIDFTKYKLILDFLKEYRQAFSLEKNLDIEKRLEALEAKG